jgi:hypothetical protein
MAVSLQTINLGDYANDGTGDDLRTAFAKVNINFSALNSENDITGLQEDPNPRLGGDLDLNGFKLISTEAIRLDAGQVVISGSVIASEFVGQISDISNHKLDSLSDVEVPDTVDLVQGQALIYNGNGIWSPGDVSAFTTGIDGGGSSTIFNLDEGEIIDGGNA